MNDMDAIAFHGSTALAGNTANVPAVASGAVPFGQSGERFNVNELLRIILKWKWLILGSTLACVIVAAIITLVMTPIYQATVMIQVNSDPGDVMGSQTQIQPATQDQSQFLNTQYGLLRSRSLAARVAQSTNLANDKSFASGATPEERLKNATSRLVANFSITPQPGSQLIELSYLDPSAQRATAIANAFANSFIYSNLERRYDATTYARNFLQTRLAAIRARLEQTERQLVDYAQRQGILELGGAPTTGQTQNSGDSLSAQSLVALNQSLAQAMTDRITAEARYREAMQSSDTAQVIDDPAVQQLRTQRAQLQGEYDQKLATFKPDLPDMVELKAHIKSIDRNIAEYSSDVRSSLRASLAEATGREQRLRGQVAGLKSNVFDLRSRGIQYNILQRDVDTNRALYDALLQRYKEIGVAGGVGESQALIVDAAQQPGHAYRPNPPLNIAIGIVVGLVLGFATALAIEFLDDTIKSPEDVLGKLRAQLLGLVPQMSKELSLPDQLADQRSHVSESYFAIMTALQFVTSKGMPTTLLITSSRAAEGKTSTALALAQNGARIGLSTLLIDADMRKPSFKSKLADGMGLSRLLTNRDTIEPHIVETVIPNLSLLPSGLIPPNPAELLSTGRIAAIIRECAEAYDLVVIDSPPVLGLADAPILSSICEATVMVVQSGVPRRPVLNSLRRLQEAKARIAGIVLTKFDLRSTGAAAGYGYGYAYGYGEEYGKDADRRPQIDVLT